MRRQAARIAFVVQAALFAAACTGRSALDPAKVNALRKQTASYADAPYLGKTVTLFRTTDVLPDLDVRALGIAGGSLYAGTPSGLLRLKSDGASFERVDTSTRSGVTDLATSTDGKLLVARADRVDVFGTDGKLETTRTASTSTLALTAVTDVEGRIFAGTGRGVLMLDRPGGAVVSLGRTVAVHDLASWGRIVYVATGVGVLRFDASTMTVLEPLAAPRLADDDVRAIVIGGGGAKVLIASATGVTTIPLDGSAASIVTPGKEGFADADFRAITESNGDLLVGNGIGASFSSATKREHFHSLRWMPAEEVTSVAIADDGTRYLGTHAGISRIALEMTTLAKKAETLEGYFDRYWRMDGFVDPSVVFDDAWNLSSKPHVSDTDNDGLWTEMQIGTWCLAYAATKDERFYQSARRATDAMMLEFDVPGETFAAKGMSKGFITRSLVREDEGQVYSEKMTQSNWHQQAFGGHTYYWKDDTSSDEYTGHFFGLPLFYDLCAKTEAEREQIRSHAKSAIDYLIAHQYLLIDLNGKPTTFGVWKDLGAASDGIDACTARYHYDVGTCIYSNFGAGWLNSIEILGYLLATWHMTGDKKYYDEYERLHTKERYGKMVPLTSDTWTVTKPDIANHSDHELATLAYYILLRYEPNADRRAIWEKSILDFYEAERPEHNPWELSVVASTIDKNVDLDAGMASMRQLPLDLRDMLYDNSHRVDADRGPNDRSGSPQFTRVFPYDEIRYSLWNGNPYSVSDGGDARVMTSPTPYLIAYWTARYHGLILAP
jgi:hypothetical protein